MTTCLGFYWWERRKSRNVDWGVKNCWWQCGRQLVVIAWFCVYVLRLSGITSSLCDVDLVLFGTKNLGTATRSWCEVGRRRHVGCGNETDVRGRADQSRCCIGIRPSYHNQCTCWAIRKIYCGYGNVRDLEWKVGHEKDNDLAQIS